jgi:hypothetical protein
LALGGRPKEEGGHKPLKISVEKFIADALEKVGNKSQFIEKVARPVLEELDPGDASFFLWQIDAYISQGIIEAAKNEDFRQVQALGWLASQLEDARKLCGIPLEKPAQIGKAELANQYEKRLDVIRLENLSDPNIALVDLLFLILTLPPHIQDMLIPEIQQALLLMTIVNRNPSWQKEEKKKKLMPVFILYFINKIPTLLHEQPVPAGAKAEFDLASAIRNLVPSIKVKKL